MKISVITVCYNSKEFIRPTIDSVLRQDYEDMEYIIVDGVSTDGTCEIIAEYLDRSSIRYISEQDTGLYNAMNKGIGMARGDYLIFMNSGDVFSNDTVLSRMAEVLSADIDYGNVWRITKSGAVHESYRSGWRYVKGLLLQGKMICHQAMFIRRDIMLDYMYDESYRITADFNFLCRCVKDKKSLIYHDIDVVNMDNVSGISTQNDNLPVMWKEDDNSIRLYFPIWYHALRFPKYIKRKIFN